VRECCSMIFESRFLSSWRNKIICASFSLATLRAAISDLRRMESLLLVNCAGGGVGGGEGSCLSFPPPSPTASSVSFNLSAARKASMLDVETHTLRPSEARCCVIVALTCSILPLEDSSKNFLKLRYASPTTAFALSLLSSSSIEESAFFASIDDAKSEVRSESEAVRTSPKSSPSGNSKGRSIPVDSLQPTFPMTVTAFRAFRESLIAGAYLESEQENC